MPFSCKTKEIIEIQATQGTQCKIKGGGGQMPPPPFINNVAPYFACIFIISLALHENGMGVLIFGGYELVGV